ncbi:MAG: M20/M25/M40 family metallo-hydrolase [Bacteroidales bacterium]|jgi:acetylornithine deacetylase|nr:M20/M25/M40 family metallo-hydrolase [Bacteroidales bacterium]
MMQTDKYINLLVQMLAIPSVSRKEDMRADFLQSWLKKEGFRVKRVGNNLVVTANNNPEKATLILNSHMDTVPPGEGWDSDPYIPIENDGKVTGLGSNDAGASVVSLIAAYSQLVDKGLSEDIVLVISAEEEVSGDKGISSVIAMLPNLKFAVVGEPTKMQPAVAERGLMVIDAVAEGKSGHAARGEGVNAIYKAIQDIEKIRAISFSDHSDWLKDPSVNVTMINAGVGHNVVPSQCEFVVDVRSNDKYTNVRLMEILQGQCISKLIPRSMRLLSSYLKDDHPVYALLDRFDLKPFGSPTLSDMALLKMPSLKIGPGDSARSHTANEYIFAEEIRNAISMYVKLISEILKLEI